MLHRRFLACFLLLFLLTACGGSDDSADKDSPVVGSLGEQRSASTTLTPEDGGELTLKADNGDRLSLTVPANAVDEETEITVTWLAEAPDTQLTDILFALRFEPDGLSFAIPAHLTIEHDDAYDEADDVTLFWVAESERVLAMTVDPIIAATDVYLPHFSDYAGAKGGPNMEFSCMEANWLDPAPTCLEDLPMINNLMKCAAQASRDGASESDVWDYIHTASNLFLGSFKKMRAKAIPEDDYCHRYGSGAGKYIEDLYTCINVPGIGTPGFLDDDDYDEIYRGIEEAATELAQAWLDSDPPTGDSCYKLGEVQEWLDYAACLVADPTHRLDEHELFSDHLLNGKVMVQEEFLGTSIPSNHDELCGWYLDCLNTHMGHLSLTRSTGPDAENVAQNIERRLNETEAQCMSLWDAEIELHITQSYAMSGMEEYEADYTITVTYKDISIDAERDDMQTAMQSINELGGIVPGMKDNEGRTLETPFFTNLDNGGQIIQMSFMLDLDAAHSWDLTDNGSDYTCLMDFACGTVSDFEARKAEPSPYPGASPSGQLMMMRTRANQDVNWARSTLPANSGYLIWRFENLVDLCRYDTEEGEWSCERPTMGTVAEPRPDAADVVSEPEVPDHHFFNAHLTPQQVKNVLDRKGFSYSYDLTNHLEINDGAVLEDQVQAVTVTLTPKN